MTTESLDQLLARSLEGALTYRCLSVVAELGVADALADGALPLDELAARCGADPLTLGRVLRLLAPSGVFHEGPPVVFALGPLGHGLRSGVPGSVRDRLRAAWQDLAWSAYGALPAAVRTGRSAFDLAFGMPVFDYFAVHPEYGAAFDRAMARVSAPEDAAIAAAFDFSAARRIVDVGGGRGGLLRAVLARHPQATGVLLDRTGVIADVDAASFPAGRLAVQAGDFFASVPPGGDLYLLKRILHDWSDADAIGILRNIRAVLGAGGQGVLVIEAILGDGNEPDPVKVQDINMLALTPGRERRRDEFNVLFAAAGLRLAEGPLPVAGFSVQLLRAVPA
jgi:hypothetical protein